MTRGHRGVGREHAAVPHPGLRLLEIGARLELPAQQFQSQKGGVAFVQVVDGRSDSQCLQQAHAADSHDHFLADAGCQVPAVKLWR